MEKNRIIALVVAALTSVPGSWGLPRLHAAASSACSSVRIGMSANLFANQSPTPTAPDVQFDRVHQAGATLIFYSPKWSELEPQPNQYDFRGVDYIVDKAIRYNSALVLNLKIIDTTQRTFPVDIVTRRFNDPVVQSRLAALLKALVPHMKHRVDHLILGNEIDIYFNRNPADLNDYATLFMNGAHYIKLLEPGIQISATVAFSGIPQFNTTLKPFRDFSDYLSITYYPINADYTIRSPAEVSADFNRMIAAAGNKKIFLQEAGLPSAAVNGSSPDLQTTFYSNVFQNLRLHSNVFWGTNFFVLADLSDAAVETYVQYYGLSTTVQFKGYLKTLGVFDDQANPKPAWTLFQQEAQSLRQALTPACAPVSTAASDSEIPVLVFPNPWRSDLHAGHAVTFSRLLPNSTIKIFTLSGHEVRTLSVSSSSVSWDLTNDSGDRVASGLYLYLMNDPQDRTQTGRLAVIK